MSLIFFFGGSDWEKWGKLMGYGFTEMLWFLCKPFCWNSSYYFLPKNFYSWPFWRVPGSTHSCLLKVTRKRTGYFLCSFVMCLMYLLIRMCVVPTSKGMRKGFFISIHNESYVSSRMYVCCSFKYLQLPNTKVWERVRCTL